MCRSFNRLFERTGTRHRISSDPAEPTLAGRRTYGPNKTGKTRGQESGRLADSARVHAIIM